MMITAPNDPWLLWLCVHVLGGGGGGGGGDGGGGGGLLALLVSDPAVCERSQASQISVSRSYFSGRSWCVAHLVWRDVCCLLTRLPA